MEGSSKDKENQRPVVLTEPPREARRGERQECARRPQQRGDEQEIPGVGKGTAQRDKKRFRHLPESSLTKKPDQRCPRQKRVAREEKANSDVSNGAPAACAATEGEKRSVGKTQHQGHPKATGQNEVAGTPPAGASTFEDYATMVQGRQQRILCLTRGTQIGPKRDLVGWECEGGELLYRKPTVAQKGKKQETGLLPCEDKGIRKMTRCPQEQEALPMTQIQKEGH